MKEILCFLRELRDNNNREWFNENKERYLGLKQDFDRFVEKLIGRIAVFDEEVAGVEVKDCVYRIYRDVRFSPNKEPYKIHFAAFVAARGGRNSPRGGYYVHIQPDGCFLAGGIYCPEPALLKRLRQDIYDNIDELTSIIRSKEFARSFPDFEGQDKLKKVPAPFPADFPEADLLKYKHYSVSGPKPDVFFEEGDVLEKIVEEFRVLHPFNRFLNYTLDN